MYQLGALVTTSFTMSIVQAKYVDHLQSFQLSPLLTGLVFTISVGAYGVSAICWGWVTSNVFSPAIVTAIGTIIQVTALLARWVLPPLYNGWWTYITSVCPTEPLDPTLSGHTCNLLQT